MKIGYYLRSEALAAGERGSRRLRDQGPRGLGEGDRWEKITTKDDLQGTQRKVK